MNLSGLHLPAVHLPDRLLRGIPGIGVETLTAGKPSTAPLSMFDPLFLGCER